MPASVTGHTMTISGISAASAAGMMTLRDSATEDLTATSAAGTMTIRLGSLTTAPPTPTGLRATVRIRTALDTYTVSWNASPGATSYRWQWRITTRESWRAGRTLTATSFVETTLQRLIPLMDALPEFRVQARNAAGDSAYTAGVFPTTA